MGSRRAVAIGVIATVCAPGGAWAAGGAHVVDDAEVETPGHCHLELWATRLRPRRSPLVVVEPCDAGGRLLR